jgi:transposase-like protein
MPCPKCNHTMKNLGLDQSGRRSFWCDRCGTVKTESTDKEREWSEYEVPKIVARAAALLDELKHREMTSREMRLIAALRECTE